MWGVCVDVGYSGLDKGPVRCSTPPWSLCLRFDEGVALCESLLELCPESCTLRDALADLHIRNANGEQAVSMWLHALAECPNNAEVFYHCCTFLMAQVGPLWHRSVLRLSIEPFESDRNLVLFPGEGERHPSSLQRFHLESV